jgi:hypothetical protein
MDAEMLKASDAVALRSHQKKASTGSTSVTSPPSKAREAST